MALPLFRVLTPLVRRGFCMDKSTVVGPLARRGFSQENSTGVVPPIKTGEILKQKQVRNMDSVEKEEPKDWYIKFFNHNTNVTTYALRSELPQKHLERMKKVMENPPPTKKNPSG